MGSTAFIFTTYVNQNFFDIEANVIQIFMV